VAYELDRRPGAWVREQTARRERRIWIGLAVGFLVTGAFLALAVGRHVSIAASAAFLAAVLLVRPTSRATSIGMSGCAPELGPR
jgi:hypothetical protein